MPINASSENPRITIVVSGGMVQRVFTTLETEAEVDILDFDDNGTMSETERKELDDYFARVRAEQRPIY